MSGYTLLENNMGPGEEYWYPVASSASDEEVVWPFIRKVHSMVAIQLLFTTAVGVAVVSCHPLVTFLTTTDAGLACYVIILLCPIIALWPLFYYTEQHPVEGTVYSRYGPLPNGPTSHPFNYVLLGIFTFAFSIAVGASCAFTGARVILEALILTSAMAVSLMLSTFWLGKINDKHYAFLSCGVGVFTVLAVASFIQIFFPLVKISMMICASLYAIIHCAYVFFDIRISTLYYAYDEYILAAMSVAFYLDIYRLFAFIVSICRGEGYAH